jgi:small-conductance mechanosensitive channel
VFLVTSNSAEHVRTVARFFWLQLIVVGLIFLLSATPRGNTAERGIAEPAKTGEIPSSTTTPASPAAIPLEDVPGQALQVDTLIRGLAPNLADNTEVQTIAKFLPELQANLPLELKSTAAILKEQPGPEMLQSQQEVWQQRRLQLTGWLNVLTNRATKLQVALTQLKRLNEIWRRTREADEAVNAPDPLKQQINRTLAAIHAAEEPYQKQRNELVNLQSNVAEALAICNAALAQIVAVQEMAVGGLLTPQNQPIWAVDLAGRAKSILSERVPQAAASYRADILQYIRDPSRHMPQHVAIFIILSLILLAARRRLAKSDAAGSGPDHGSAVFDHVFASALLLTLMIVTEPSSPAPVTVKRLLQVAALGPIIILTRRVILPNFIPLIYALAILLVTDTVRGAIASDLSMGQAILVLEAAIGILVLSWVSFSERQKPARFFERTIVRRQPVDLSLMFVLSIGLVAAVFGYMRLAHLAISGAVAGGALALELYASLQVAIALVRYALRLPPFDLLKLVQHHRNLLITRIYRISLWVIAVGWLGRYLDYLGVLQPARSVATEFLNMTLERGSITISVADICAFFLTVLGSFLLSKFIRFVLEEDVYPRTAIAAGRSYAVSRLLNYTLIAVGFVLAIGFLGVDMTKMTVLAGAFGVGIGFGLQSVVNNFVSGLILLFERPIELGDSVQIGNLQGVVRRIGIRASIIRSAQGAEIIVPNAHLITQEVTNWTLSDRLRRLDLPVGVSYDAAPKKAIEVLERAARAHPNVLNQPAPVCVFLSYGDNSMNFELRVWTDYTNSQQVRTDLNVAIYDAIYAAGMSFPSHERKLVALSDGNASTLRP